MSKKTKVIFSVFVMIVFSLCLIMISKDRIYAAEKESGWDKGRTHYYENGIAVKGWTKISGKWYYFQGKNGMLVKNQIAGNKKGGYYYVDGNGVRITDKVTKRAVKVVRKITKTKWSRSKKLRTCFNFFVYKCQYEKGSESISARKIPKYASYMFTHRKGNCYRGAAAFAYCAKVLGYKVRVGYGGVTARGPYASLSPHGWTEIKIGSKWYMYDISFARHHNPDSLYKIRINKYPFRLRKDGVYRMSVDGKVKWK